MRLLFAGTPEAAVPSLRRLVDSPHEVVGVLTRPDARSGRGRREHPSPVAAVAEQLGIPTLKPRSAKDPELLAQVREVAPDCCPVVAYGGLLPAQLLDVPAHGWVNLHFSLLPAWRGAAPVQHAIWRGDQITGASTFRIVPELDAGPVFGMVTETIGPSDTSGDLLGRLAESGAGLLAATMDGIAAGRLVAEPQSEEGVSLAPKITTADAEIDWSTPAMHVDRLVRACTPSPGAWTSFRGDRLKVGSLTPAPDSDPLDPGMIRATKNAVEVGTATYPVRLDLVQPPGKRPMPASDWARGSRITAAEQLG